MSIKTIFDDAIADIFDALGCDISYKGGTIKGDFIEYSRTIHPETGEIEAMGPFVDLMNADCAGIAQGDSLVINGGTYKVTGPPEKRKYGTTTVYLVKI